MTLKTRIPVVLRRSVKIARARAAEVVNSERFSKPALNRLDDQMLSRLPATGTFLEIGANDGYSQSNTYYLERRRGWSGILIEPNPKLYRLCRRVRPRSQCFNFACVDTSDIKSITLATNSNDLMAVTRGLQDRDDESARISGGTEITVPATLLSSLIDRSGESSIDFMSVDVEGAEAAVLGGLDLARHTPRWLLVETKYPQKIDELLAGHMTRVDQLSHHDYLWASEPAATAAETP
jgi:FkbM family methyltransferase